MGRDKRSFIQLTHHPGCSFSIRSGPPLLLPSICQALLLPALENSHYLCMLEADKIWDPIKHIGARLLEYILAIMQIFVQIKFDRNLLFTYGTHFTLNNLLRSLK